MGWTKTARPAARINTRSDRWQTSCHEIAHLLAGHLHGFTVTGAVVYDNDLGNTDWDERSRPRRTSERDARPLRALVALAGPAVHDLRRWKTWGCDTDRELARRHLRGTAVNMRDVEDAALQFVSAHWAAIENHAAVLFRDGQIGRAQLR